MLHILNIKYIDCFLEQDFVFIHLKVNPNNFTKVEIISEQYIL